MANDKKQLATIPEVPNGVDPALRRTLTAIKEALDVRLGRRGDPLEEGVTRRDLIDAGLAKKVGSAGLGRPDLSLGDLVPGPPLGVMPPVPIAFQAEGVFGGIVLSWELPQKFYDGHADTEIWRSATANPESRVQVGIAVGSSYFDTMSELGEATFYYWIRFVSVTGRKGPFSQVEAATKPEDMGELLKRLSGAIDESELSQALNERLDDTETEILEQSKIVKGLSAQYTLRLNVNGYVAGFGLYNDGVTSDFAVQADRFWIAPPGSYSKIKPFIVQNGTVYIDTAMIREASIQQGKIGPISFGKITDAQGNPVTTVGGKLKATSIETDQLWTAIANAQTAFIGSASIGYAAIGRAHIQDLAVDTLKIAGNAVTIPLFGQASWAISPASMTTVLSLQVWVDQPGYLYASSSGYISYGRGWGDTQSRLVIAGVPVSHGGGAEAWVSAAHSGAVWVPAGSHAVELQFCSPSGRGTIQSRSLFAMMVKK